MVMARAGQAHWGGLLTIVVHDNLFGGFLLYNLLLPCVNTQQGKAAPKRLPAVVLKPLQRKAPNGSPASL